MQGHNLAHIGNMQSADSTNLCRVLGVQSCDLSIIANYVRSTYTLFQFYFYYSGIRG